jgi:nucleoside 2-deoxyribosyltransferase
VRGLPPLNEDAEATATGLEAWRSIYEKDVAMMEKSDIIIANLTPFAGASADAGTLIEVGWFLGRGKPIFGYSNTPETFETRMRKQLGPMRGGLGIEGFHLPDNLMIAGAGESGGYPIFLPTDGNVRDR